MTRPTGPTLTLAAAALAAAWLGAASATGGIPPRPEQAREDLTASGYVDQVQVSLVVLHVTVLDRRGAPVHGLTPSDFSIFEDGRPRAVSVFGSSADQPVKVAFLLDVSGSMGLLRKLDRAKEAIRSFAGALGPGDEVALLIFADGRVVVKLGFTSDRDALDAALGRIEAYGRTALRDALAEAPSLLAAAEAGRRALVILTDGVDNASTVTTWEAIHTARRAAVPILAVGMADLPLDLRADRRPPGGGRTVFETLTQFTRGTGGEFFPVFGPGEIQAAVRALDERLRGQYILGYDPGPSGDLPGFHRIEVATRNDRHVVLTREGYYSGP
jgi:VWFA-related protein